MKDASVRARLRTATALDHERVDRVYSRANLRCRSSYARFLVAQAAAHIPIEEALTVGGVASLLPDWRRRRRTAHLVADLTELRLPLPATEAPLVFVHSAAMLGAVYVLEGSRLGGHILSRQVPAGLPTNFLNARDPHGWRELIGLLEEKLRDTDDFAIAVTAATVVFDSYVNCGLRFLGDETHAA